MKSSPVKWTACVVLSTSWALMGQPVTVTSRSGQFLATGPAVVGTALPTVAMDRERVALDPALLAVSCERIKSRLLQLLKLSDGWRGRVLATIDPRQGRGDAIMLRARRFADGWQYDLRLPVEVDRRHLVKTLVEILLQEMANRESTARPVELPPWLAEGLTSLMEEDHYSYVTLQPQITVARQVTARDPMASVKAVLAKRPALSLDELNWPEEDPAGEDATFTACAHLMVYELLRLEDGPDCMVRTLRLLPRHRNWQFAFLGGFQDHFARLIDWDKWWSLLLVNVANRDVFAAWSAEESWLKFEDILTTPVEVRVRDGELPMTARANLQSIIREWDHASQMELLALKLNHLNALRIRASSEVVELVDGYREVLENYLEQRSRPGMARRFLPGIRDELMEETLAKLDALEGRKATVRRLLDLAKGGRLSQAP